MQPLAAPTRHGASRVSGSAVCSADERCRVSAKTPVKVRDSERVVPLHGYSFSYLVHVCNRETRAAAAHTKLHTRHRSMARATYLAPEDGPGVVAELKGAAGRLRETRAAHRRVRDTGLLPAAASACLGCTRVVAASAQRPCHWPAARLGGGGFDSVPSRDTCE